MMTRTSTMLALCLLASPVCAQNVAGFADHRGATLAEVTLTDESGRSEHTRDLFGKPFFLAFAYHSCPQLCGLVLGELTDALRQMPRRAGKDFDVVVVSIDPMDTPSVSSIARQRYVARYGGDGSGWHFLTGDEDSIHRFAESAGFEYVHDPIQKTFTHPAGVFYIRRGGVIAGHREADHFTPASLQSLMDGESDGDSMSAWTRLCGALGFGPGDKTSTVLAILRCVALGIAAAMALLLWRRRRRLQ